MVALFLAFFFLFETFTLSPQMGALTYITINKVQGLPFFLLPHEHLLSFTFLATVIVTSVRMLSHGGLKFHLRCLSIFHACGSFASLLVRNIFLDVLTFLIRSFSCYGLIAVSLVIQYQMCDKQIFFSQSVGFFLHTAIFFCV